MLEKPQEPRETSGKTGNAEAEAACRFVSRSSWRSCSGCISQTFIDWNKSHNKIGALNFWRIGLNWWSLFLLSCKRQMPPGNKTRNFSLNFISPQTLKSLLFAFVTIFTWHWISNACKLPAFFAKWKQGFEKDAWLNVEIKKITVNQLDIAAVQNQKGEVFFHLLTTARQGIQRGSSDTCAQSVVSGLQFVLNVFVCLFAGKQTTTTYRTR